MSGKLGTSFHDSAADEGTISRREADLLCDRQRFISRCAVSAPPAAQPQRPCPAYTGATPLACQSLSTRSPGGFLLCPLGKACSFQGPGLLNPEIPQLQKAEVRIPNRSWECRPISSESTLHAHTAWLLLCLPGVGGTRCSPLLTGLLLRAWALRSTCSPHGSPGRGHPRSERRGRHEMDHFCEDSAADSSRSKSTAMSAFPHLWSLVDLQSRGCLTAKP